jgi:hypothetical protein
MKSPTEIIATLGLQPHPEGGYYREIYRSAGTLPLPRGTRAVLTSIWFLLPPGTFSAWHRVRSDEVWSVFEGALDLHLLDDAGTYRLLRLGSLEAGVEPQAVVPAGTLQAAEPRGDTFVLCGCVVAPGFDFADFRMPPGAELTARFPEHAEVIARLTRA